MLTKDLLNVRLVGERVLPCFVSVADESLLALADRMLDAYEPGRTRGEIDEVLDTMSPSCRNLKLFNGIRKILDDRAGFSAAEDCDYADMRRNVFKASASALRSGGVDVESDYVSAVRNVFPVPAGGLYGDLPACECLVRKLDMSAREVLERYNCGLVQGLLLYSRNIELEFRDVLPSRLRRLMRALKFFRLVADVVCRGRFPRGDMPADIRMVVDGPGSVLANARSYGLQLASFFPNVCLMPVWKLKAKVEYRGKLRNLNLDESCSLVYNGRSSSAYVPEEVEVFKRRISEKLAGSGWHMDEECPYIKCKGGMLLFPDFAFVDDSGRYRYLELFHRWHFTQLEARLQALESGADWPLVIGVDSAVASRPDIVKLLEESEYFQKNGFIYRDYPVPDKVIKLL